MGPGIYGGGHWGPVYMVNTFLRRNLTLDGTVEHTAVCLVSNTQPSIVMNDTSILVSFMISL